MFNLIKMFLFIWLLLEIFIFSDYRQFIVRTIHTSLCLESENNLVYILRDSSP